MIGIRLAVSFLNAASVVSEVLSFQPDSTIIDSSSIRHGPGLMMAKAVGTSHNVLARASTGRNRMRKDHSRWSRPARIDHSAVLDIPLQKVFTVSPPFVRYHDRTGIAGSIYPRGMNSGPVKK